MVLTGKY